MDFNIFDIVELIVLFSCKVKDLCYRAPGTQINILNNVSFRLPQKRYTYYIALPDTRELRFLYLVLEEMLLQFPSFFVSLLSGLGIMLKPVAYFMTAYKRDIGISITFLMIMNVHMRFRCGNFWNIGV